MSGVVGACLTIGSGFSLSSNFSLLSDISWIWTLDFYFLIYFGFVAKNSKVSEGLVSTLWRMNESISECTE